MAARRVLVIGGTQFMGRLLVEALLKEGVEVTVLNRGVTPSPFPADSVTHLQADRLGDRQNFRKVLSNSGHWWAVVDFVAFEETHISDVIEGLRETPSKKRKADTGLGCFRVQHYVFISSDSLFVGCYPATGSRTEADVQPLAGDALRKVEARESYQVGYGKGKLACEEALAKAFVKEQFPWIGLRLPDVIGPCDNLGCHLQLQTAIICGDRIGLKCSAPGVNGRTLRASVAFAPDVVRAILALISLGSKAFGEVFHVCCDESTTLEDYATILADALSKSEDGKEDEAIAPLFSMKRRAPFLCVNIGPLDNSKLKRFLPAWNPTPLKQAIQATTQWYLSSANALYTLQLSKDDDD